MEKLERLEKFERVEGCRVLERLEGVVAGGEMKLGNFLREQRLVEQP